MASTRRASAAVGTPSRPVRSSRRQVTSYNESTSAESNSDEGEQQATSWRGSARRRSITTRNIASSNRPKRTVRGPRSYREPSSDEDLERVISRYPEMVTPSKSSQPSPRPSRRSTAQQQTAASPIKRKRTTVQSPRKRRHPEPSTNITTVIDVNESAPPWHTLPYHVLFSIFLYAFPPLEDTRLGPHTGNGKKLLDIAILCRAFAEPALSALYHTLALMDSVKAHKISHVLSEPIGNLSVNYSTKVQEVLMDTRSTLVYKTGIYGYFDLCRFIQRVPHIKTLRLFDSKDGKYPLWAERNPKWNYPFSLFDTLTSSNVRLHTFDWNCRYMEPRALIETMLARHLEAPFQTIRKLNIFHFPSDDMVAPRITEYTDATEQVIETGLGAALCQLPDLRAVTFTDCGAVNELLFVGMPSTLKSLTLDNCDEVGTTAFSAFLGSHGANLRELVLKHNRHLNMSFMTILKDACPNLERLSADFIMHNWPPHYNGMPHFKSLFKAGEVPTWPSSLQEIELLQLRQWDKPRAATFLSSLVDAAPELKDLRKIVISATVHMGWQDRASFRRQWIDTLERTFLRRDNRTETVKAASPNLNPSPEQASSETAGQRHSHRQSARLARQRLSGIDVDEEEEGDSYASGDQEENDESAGDPTGTYIQGLCDVVSLRIDNLRPADTQFSEGDFLDSEQSGDEDWEGEDWDPDNDRHAW